MSNLSVRNIPELILASAYNVQILGGKLIGSVYMMPCFLRLIVTRNNQLDKIRRFEMSYDSLLRVIEVSSDLLVCVLTNKQTIEMKFTCTIERNFYAGRLNLLIQLFKRSELINLQKIRTLTVAGNNCGSDDTTNNKENRHPTSAGESSIKTSQGRVLASKPKIVEPITKTLAAPDLNSWIDETWVAPKSQTTDCREQLDKTVVAVVAAAAGDAFPSAKSSNGHHTEVWNTGNGWM